MFAGSWEYFEKKNRFIRELQGRTELQNAGTLKVPVGDLRFRVDCPRLGSHRTTKTDCPGFVNSTLNQNSFESNLH
jgi:hypothetical protein